jgi:hypothetical protein
MESREEPCRAMNVLFSAPCVLRGTALARLGRASTSADISRRLTGRHSMSSAAHTAPARILCSYCCSCRNVFVSSSLDPRGGYNPIHSRFNIAVFSKKIMLFDCGPENAARRAAPRPRGHRGPAPHRPPRTPLAGRLGSRTVRSRPTPSWRRAASYESVRPAWHGLRRTLITRTLGV